MQFCPSPFQKHLFANRSFYIKRDDLLDTHFSGNKARKFYYFLSHDFPHIKRLVSYGSNQSNAMYSLSVLAQMKGWEFIYFCDHIPSFLKENPIGNYKYALQNGMHIIESTQRHNDADTYKNESTLFIEEGGRQKEAEYGIKILADELLRDIQNSNMINPYLFLPSGTGTTALYLQKHLPYRVFTCSCVGSDAYLKEQFKMVEKEESFYPKILNSPKKYHYGKLDLELYTLWSALKEEMGVTFDLMYDPVGWKKLLLHVETIEGTPIFIHQGGLLGNESMLERYKRKYNV